MQAATHDVRAVVFDLDGVLIDSEPIWEDVRKRYVSEAGGTYAPTATRDIMGMSAPEWSHYLRTRLGVSRSQERINHDVVERVAAALRAHVPLLPGAVAAVQRLAERWPLGLASSSNRSLIELVLELTRLRGCFWAVVSSEEVPHGKPAPDVYLRAAELLGIAPERCCAVEDSSNGIRAAKAAGLRTIAIPNAHFPPAPEVVALADVVLPSLFALTPERVVS